MADGLERVNYSYLNQQAKAGMSAQPADPSMPRRGEIKNFTGIDDPYETPEGPIDCGSPCSKNFPIINL